MICIKRVISLIVASAAVISLYGCSRETSGRSPGPTATAAGQATQTEQSQPAADAADSADLLLHSDILAHTEHNQSLPTTKEELKKAEAFDLYVVNVQALEGFTSRGSGVTAYQNGLQSVFDAAYDMFSPNAIGAYAMSYRDSQTGKTTDTLSWYKADDNEAFRRSIQGSQFYHDNVLPQEGAIASLFQSGNTPFRPEALTVLVSNFAEPGFNLNALSKGIEHYFDANDHSAAAIIGFTSEFAGNLYIPENDGGRYGSTFYIQDYSGSVPVYLVVVGPEESVNIYLEAIGKYLNNQNILYRTACYRNSVYEPIQAPPLSFTIIPDNKAKKIAEPIWSSFNTGTMSFNDPGTAFAATFAGVETRGAVQQDNGDTSKSTQISLVSDNYDGISQYSCDYTLYVYNPDLETWENAGKNANSVVELELSRQEGEQTDEIEGQVVTVLAEGVTQYCLIARLNFDEGSPLTRENIYRLEVRLRMNRENPDASSGAINTELKSYGTTSTEYYYSAMQVGALTAPNRIWTATMTTDDRVAAQTAFAHTPNLDSLLTSLEGLESKYVSDEILTEYIDILFNLPDTQARR